MDYLSVSSKSLERNENHDCSVKAIALATGYPYDFIHTEFKSAGRKSRKPTPRLITVQLVEDLGYKWVNVTHKYDARTVRTLEQEVSVRKILIVFVKRHVLCIRDGKVQDWTAGRMNRVQQIFELQRSNTMATATKKKKVTKKVVVKKATKGKKGSKGTKKATTNGEYGIEKSHDLPWTDKKVAIFKALKVLRATSVLAARDAKTIAAKAGVTPKNVRHYCYHAMVSDLTAVATGIENMHGYGFYLTPKGTKVDAAKELKTQNKK